jgi:hypothetical protein
MPQAKGGDKKSTSIGQTTSRGAESKQGAAGSTTRGGRGKSSSGSEARTSGSTGEARSTHTGASADSPDAGFEAAAKRIRNLNERIIDAGKQTGETTLSAYEKALNAIATAVERGPGRSDIDWIAQLATAQAKFIREVTDAWTSAARQMLK